MGEIVIKGGKPLFGRVRISGSKNGALPILFATLVTRGVSRLRRVPDIGDVRVAMEILERFGARITEEGDFLCVDTTRLEYTEPPAQLLSKIRASTYLIGASLGRFGRCRLASPGGCNFSDRPIDMHLFAAELFGASLSDGCLCAPSLHGANIYFDKPSVGATTNALILASAVNAVTKIRGFAREPHVMALAEFLVSAGARIDFSEDEITVVGGELHGGRAEIIGDMIEAGTYLCAGLITGGEITVEGVDIGDMTTFVDFITEIGASVSCTCDTVTARMCENGRPAALVASPYPGFPTDLQPIAAPLMASLCGGEIRDDVWRERFGYLSALSRFGVRYTREDNSARIFPSKMTAAAVSAPDLRGGAACVLAALAARGESRIASAQTVLRGYESLDKKFRSVGADIIITDCN